MAPPLDNAAGTLNEPGGICVLPSKPHLYIADTNNHAVKILDLQTRQLSLVCVDAKSTIKHSSRIPPPGYPTARYLTPPPPSKDLVPVIPHPASGGQTNISENITFR